MQKVGKGETKLHYQKMGAGPRVLLAFHGFAQDSSIFQPLADVLTADYTIFSFDLFYHGNSRLSNADVPLQKRRLTELVMQVLEKENVSTFSLLGFSMGGKFALTLIESMASRVEEVILIAPDGISTSFWYNIATYPGFLQQLFKRTVLKPKPFFRVVDFLHRRRLLAPGLARFAHWHMDSLSKRLRVYQSWMGFRELNFDIRQIVKLINGKQIPIRLFLGSHDQVITPRRIKVFARVIPTCELILLTSGHTLLIKEVANYLRKKAEE